MENVKKYICRIIKIIAKLIMIVFLLYFMLWTWLEYFAGRENYKFGNNQYITIWKRGSGYCYLMPYKYCGLILPNKNFIIANNTGNIGIYYNPNDTTFFIDDGRRESDKSVNMIYLPDYKYQHLNYPDYSYLPIEDKLDSLNIYQFLLKEKLKNFPSISISIKDLYVKTYP